DGVAGVVGRAGRAVRHVDVRANAHARLAAGGLAAPGDGRDGVAGVVGRAGRAVRDVDVRANALARLPAGRLAATGDGRDGVAGVVGRARRAVGDVPRDTEAHPDAQLVRRRRITQRGQARGARRTAHYGVLGGQLGADDVLEVRGAVVLGTAERGRLADRVDRQPVVRGRADLAV